MSMSLFSKHTLFLKNCVMFLFSLFFFLACTNTLEIQSQKEQEVESIDIPADFISCSLQSDAKYIYDISAVAKPEKLPKSKKKLIYAFLNGDEKGASIDVENNKIIFSKAGRYILKISSEKGNVSREMTFDILKEDIVKPLSLDDSSTVFGSYKVGSYSLGSLNSSPNEKPAGDMELYITTNGLNLLFNGVLLDITPSSVKEVIANGDSNQIASAFINFLNLKGINADTNNAIFSLMLDESAADTLADYNGLEKVIALSMIVEKRSSMCSDVIANNMGIKEHLNSKINNEKKVENIIIDGNSLNLTDQVRVVVEPSNSTNKELIYSSSDSSIVEVSPTGHIRGHKNGKATITVTLKDGEDGVEPILYNVEVKNCHLQGLKFTNLPKNNQLRVGDTFTFKASPIPDIENLKNIKISYNVTHKALAFIDSATGILKANREGVIRVRAFADGIFQYTEEITILPKEKLDSTINKVVDINHLPEKLYLLVGEDYSIAPIPFPKSYAGSCAHGDDFTKCFTYKIEKAEGNDYKGNINELIDVDGGKIQAKKYLENQHSFILTVSYDENIYKNINLFIEKDVVDMEVVGVPEKVYVSAGDFGSDPFYITATPLPAGVKSNREFKSAYVTDANIARVEHEPTIEEPNRWKVTPIKPGNIDIKIEVGNGVEKDISIPSIEVMNIGGYYEVESVEYNISQLNKYIKFSKSENTTKFEGEVAIHIDKNGEKLENSPRVYLTGRVQFIPKDIKNNKLYEFNDFRYKYFSQIIDLDITNIYPTFEKSNLEKHGFDFIDNKRLRWIIRDNSGNEYLLTLVKKTDSLEGLNASSYELEDNSLFITPVNIKDDPYSIRGYYQLTKMFQNVKLTHASIIQANVQAIFTHDFNEFGGKIASSGFFTYDSWKTYSFLKLNSEGGSGTPNGAVKAFKGEAAMYVDKKNNNGDVATFSAQHKTQSYDESLGATGWHPFLRYAYFLVYPIDISYLNSNFESNSMKYSNTIVQYSSYENNLFDMRDVSSSKVYYERKSDDQLLFETQIPIQTLDKTNDGKQSAKDASQGFPIEGGWIYKKVSDIPPVNIIHTGYVGGVTDSNPVAIPRESQVIPLKNLSGPNNDIHF